jgi:hypothetical protein
MVVKLYFKGTSTDKHDMRKRFAMMTGNGDDVIEYDDKDPSSIKQILKKICEELKLGKFLYGANKGNTKRYKIADKNSIEEIAGLEDKLKTGAYEKLMLANDIGDKVVLGATPMGG